MAAGQLDVLTQRGERQEAHRTSLHRNHRFLAFKIQRVLRMLQTVTQDMV